MITIYTLCIKPMHIMLKYKSDYVTVLRYYSAIERE
jgi:hypothetical protein